MRLRTPLITDDADAFMVGLVIRMPFVKQIVDDRIKFFFRGIPRLQQVVIELDGVDRLDGCIDVRICRQQNELCIIECLFLFFEKGNAFHLRHFLVGDDKGKCFVFQLQLLE